MDSIEYDKMPKKAKNRESEIVSILNTANDLNYTLDKVDYNTGMVRMKNDFCHANLYTTTLTLTLEFKVDGMKIQRNVKCMSVRECQELLTKPRKGY